MPAQESLSGEEAVNAIPEREWQEAVASHLTWGKTWHGDLPADVFAGIWADLAREAEPLTIHVRLDTPQPIMTVPEGSPLTVEGHHILLDDGRELVLQFES